MRQTLFANALVLVVAGGLVSATVAQETAARQTQQAQAGNPTRMAQPTPPAEAGENAPKIQITPSEWNFGQVWSGTPLKGEITITNVGQGTLKLQPPRTSCGCTGSIMGKRELAAGESTTVKLSYDSKKNARNVRQTVTIMSNDPTVPQSRVMVTGEVKPVFSFAPTRTAGISFGQIDKSAVQTQTLTITNEYVKETGDKIKLSLPDAPIANYDVKLEEVEEGMEYKLVVATKPPLPAGSVHQRLNLKTDLELLPSLAVNLNAYVMPLVRVNPPVLYVSEKLSFPSSKTVTLVYKKGVELAIENITANSDKVSWEVVDEAATARGPQQYKRLKVNVPAGSEVPTEGFMLTITTNQDDPEYKTLTIPIKQAPTRRSVSVAPRERVQQVRQSVRQPSTARQAVAGEQAAADDATDGDS